MKIKPSFLTEKQEISIKLGTYDDIFSDFDMRAHADRALSVDFLEEIKRASVDKIGDNVNLTLHIPEQERDQTLEESIKTRLNNHFKRHYHILLKEKRRILTLGIMMALAGMLMMMTTTYLIFNNHGQNQFLSFLVVFLEPISLFLLWEGLDRIFFNSHEINPDLFFYKKMFKSPNNVDFKTY
jgi:hypothetical protein